LACCKASRLTWCCCNAPRLAWCCRAQAVLQQKNQKKVAAEEDDF